MPVLCDCVSPLQDEGVKVYIVIYEEAKVAGFKIVHNGGKFTKKVLTQPKHPNIEVHL